MTSSTSEPAAAQQSTMTVAAAPAQPDLVMQRIGGVAAGYLALALAAAIPYFLLVVDYPSADTTADKVDLILAHYASMYAVYLATYVVFGLAVGILTLALKERLHAEAPTVLVHLAAAVGWLWSAMLVASGLIFAYGMTAIHDLAASDQGNAVLAWRAIEPVALALGGAGGELLGGLWVLLVSLAILNGQGWPRILGWLGLVIGAVGLASTVPALHDAAVAFGLLVIIWLGWLGGVLIMADRRRRRPTSEDGRGPQR
jgi:hypothetical protein